MTDKTTPVLAVSGLDVVRDGLWLLRDIELSLAPGEVLALLGGPGSGKTTLLEALATGEGIRAGRFEVDGHTLPPADPLARRRCGLACAFARPAIVPRLSVADHLELAADAAADGRTRIARVLELLPELRGQLRLRADRLAFAAQRLVDLGRALVAARSVLLIDQPFADFRAARVRALVDALRPLGLALLLAERRMRLALEVADRAMLLVGGRIVLAAPPRELADDERVLAACLGDIGNVGEFAGEEKETARTPAGRSPERSET